MSELGRTEKVMKLAKASRLVKSPVLSEKMIRRLMMLSDREKPVREVWRRKINETAMRRSDTAEKTFTSLESVASCVRSAYVLPMICLDTC